jgi:hypothetical protein
MRMACAVPFDLIAPPDMYFLLKCYLCILVRIGAGVVSLSRVPIEYVFALCLRVFFGRLIY